MVCSCDVFPQLGASVKTWSHRRLRQRPHLVASGREELVAADGSTNAGERKAVAKATSAGDGKEPVVKGQLGKQKFGTQVGDASSCSK